MPRVLCISQSRNGEGLSGQVASLYSCEFIWLSLVRNLWSSPCAFRPLIAGEQDGQWSWKTCWKAGTSFRRIEPLMPHQLLEVPTTKRCNARSPAASMKNGQVKPKKPGEACFSKFMVSCQLPIEDPGTRKRIIQPRSEFYGRECTHIFKYLIYFEYWQSNLFSENNISIQLMYTYIYIYK